MKINKRKEFFWVTGLSGSKTSSQKYKEKN